MTSYPFTPLEQDAIRQLGKAGFRYAHETKKAIRFVDQRDRVIEFNREPNDLAFVFGFGDEAKALSISGVTKVGRRSSSNFRLHAIATTSRGHENFTGIQVWLASLSALARVIEVMS